MENNKADILHLANVKVLEQVEWLKEMVSGRVSWHKRATVKTQDELQAGDKLVVSELP